MKSKKETKKKELRVHIDEDLHDSVKMQAIKKKKSLPKQVSDMLADGIKRNI